MKQSLSAAAVLIATLGVGLAGALGGDTAPGRPAGALPWERLAELQASTPHTAAAEPNAIGSERVNVSDVEDAPEGKRAATEPAAQPVPTPELEQPARPPAPLRDPTEPGEELRDMVAPFRLGPGGRPGGLASRALPGVALKGRIIGPSAPPAAIVELQGALYVLHEESELTVDSSEAALGGLTLRVTQITSSEVRIEVMPLSQVMVLR